MNYGSYPTGIRSAPCWRVAPYNSTRSYFSLKGIPSLKHAFCHQYCTALHYFEVNGLLDKTIHSKPFESQVTNITKLFLTISLHHREKRL